MLKFIWLVKGKDSFSVATTLLLIEAGNEVSDAKVLDKGVEGLVLLDVDVFDLDLRLLGDEVHLAFTFL